MQIPIQNIYFLLCYAWNKLDEKELVDVRASDEKDLVDLLARVLISGVSRLFKKGLDRDYILYQESIPGIKGKLELGATLKKSLLQRGQAHCAFDEFSYNVLHNQILKATFRLLLKIDNLDAKLKEESLFLFRRFHQVDEVELQSQLFSRVKFNRNNYFYDFLVKICSLIFHSLLPTEEAGHYRFMDFIRDERNMAYLFEEFIRNFYKAELIGTKVYREDILWIAEGDDSSIRLLPKMQTDITVEIPGKSKLIIDTKFYKEALREHYDSRKIREANLYQLFAYLKNIEIKDVVSQNCSGLLLYPTVHQPLNEKIKVENHLLHFRTINLNQPWQSIHQDLLGIVEECLEVKG